MNREDIHSWIKHPDTIDEKATAKLERAVQEFPFSALLQQLYLKGLQNGESYLSTSQLKKTSLWVSDRKALKLWLDSEDSEDLLEVPEASIKKRVPPTPAKPEVSEVQTTTTRPGEIETAPQEVVPVPEKIEKKPATPAVKPLSTPVEGKKTELGDDLSHLPPRVRAIIEKSRKIKEDYVPEHSSEITSKPLEKGEKEPENSVETSEEIDQETPKVLAASESLESLSKDEVEETVEEVHEKWEDTIEPSDVSVPSLSEVGMMNLADIELLEDSAKVESEEEAEDPIEEPEERSFARPVVLDELTSTGPEEDSDFELDFSAWLRQKERQSKRDYQDTGTEETISDDVNITLDATGVEIQEPKQTLDRKEEKEDLRESKMDLIDRFIEEQPKIKPVKFDISGQSSKTRRDKEIDVSAMGSEVGDDFITETLAQVYVQQGHLEKAMSAYEILRLKYPEKSGFFADQISEIRRKKRNS